MRRKTTLEEPFLKRAISKIGIFLLQLAVMLTFLGIVPVIFLIYFSIYNSRYIEAILLCGILLTLIKANKMIQG